MTLHWRIRTGSDSIFADQDWTRTEKFVSPLISAGSRMRPSEPGLRTTGIHKLDRQSQPSRRRGRGRELQDQPFTFCRRFGTASIVFSNRFSATCGRAGMKISTKNTKVLCLSTDPRQCMRQVSRNTLQQLEKFKYLEVVLTSNGRRSE